MELSQLSLQAAVIFGVFSAAVGLPLALADRETRGRRAAFLALAAVAFLFIHGELRSWPALRAGMILGAGTLGALLFAIGARGYLLQRAMRAERPRSPDEWWPEAGRRLWAGLVRAAEPLPAQEGGVPPCVYRRVEVDRWDAGRWRRIATTEHRAELLELAGRARAMLLALPQAALRRGAFELAKFRACPDGWRLDPDPDPAALYRVRTVGVPQGAPLRVLARAEKRGEQGLVLRGAAADAFTWSEEHPGRLSRRAGLCAAAGLLCGLAGLWGAWP